MKLHVLALVLSPLLAAGCVAPIPDPGDPADACHASELQYLVGQPGTVLHGMRFGQQVRVIEYGMAVTMDYNPARLNIQLDRQDVIERVNCG
ncbi:Proteinase inhibitor I78 [Paracoccaceae bacterium]|jgi:hypothetical protein